jgi:DNA invertase Pin-like site-specific DNA recombinase
MNVAYIRVSTAEQNEARQVEALKVHQIERVFKEKVSGKDTNRAQLQEMLQFVREGVCRRFQQTGKVYEGLTSDRGAAK